MRNAGDAQQIEVGWWPGDRRYPRAAFFAYAALDFAQSSVRHACAACGWDPALSASLQGVPPPIT